MGKNNAVSYFKSPLFSLISACLINDVEHTKKKKKERKERKEKSLNENSFLFYRKSTF